MLSDFEGIETSGHTYETRIGLRSENHSFLSLVDPRFPAGSSLRETGLDSRTSYHFLCVSVISLGLSRVTRRSFTRVDARLERDYIKNPTQH